MRGGERRGGRRRRRRGGVVMGFEVLNLELSAEGRFVFFVHFLVDT